MKDGQIQDRISQFWKDYSIPNNLLLFNGDFVILGPQECLIYVRYGEFSLFHEENGYLYIYIKGGRMIVVSGLTQRICIMKNS